MNMQEIRERAAAVGMNGLGRLRKAELIRRIQEVEGNNPCYGAEWRGDCAQMDCCWRADCQRE